MQVLSVFIRVIKYYAAKQFKDRIVRGQPRIFRIPALTEFFHSRHQECKKSSYSINFLTISPPFLSFCV